MYIDVVTIFPDFFCSPLQTSMLGRAQQAGLAVVQIHDLRTFTDDKHRVVDDSPYGGGPGMVMKPEPLLAATEHLLASAPQDTPVIFFTPQGQPLTQERARQLSGSEHLILLCGHYEGVDERVREAVVTAEVSLGDYVLTGGEPAALVLIDAVVRLLPGVLGNDRSAEIDSFAQGLLEYPQYTRPAQIGGMKVPEVLLSGHHEQIRRWRRKESLRRTLLRRPDLLAAAQLTEEDHKWLAEIRQVLQQEDQIPASVLADTGPALEEDSC